MGKFLSSIALISVKIRHRQSLYSLVVLLFIILLGAGLRLTDLGKQPLWMDEAFSVWMSQHSIPEILQLTIQIDQHPPLYHLLLHLWTAVGGTGEYSVRSLSVFMSVLTIPVVFLLGKTLSGWRVGLISALVLAISPFQVQFAQETRSYALLSLMASLSMWMVARLMTVNYVPGMAIGDQLKAYFRKRSQPLGLMVEASHPFYAFLPHARSTIWTFLCVNQVDLTWLGYMLFSALAIFTHNTAVFLPLGINLFVFGLIFYRRSHPALAGQLQAPGLKNWIFAQVGVFILWLPWAPAFYRQLTGVSDQFWIQPPTFSLVLETLKSLIIAWLPARLSFPGLIWLGVAAIFLLAAVSNQRRMSHFIFLAVLFLTPFMGELLVSLYRPIFYDRTLIWSAIPLCVLLAEGLYQMRYRSYITTALIILITLNGLSLGNYFTYFEKERWDLATQYVVKNIQPGDAVVFNANWAQIPFDYYLPKSHAAMDEYGVPETMFMLGVLEPHMTRTDLPRLRNIIEGRKRIWLVYSHNWWTDPESLIQKELSSHMNLIDVQMYNGIQIQLYNQP